MLYTLARREKKLLRQLRRSEIGHYAPMVKRRTRSPGGRARESYVPLFAGYVFLRGDEEHRYQALTTNCISRCIAIADVERLLFDLSQVRRLIESDAPLTPEARLVPGMRVRVQSGPLSGLEGTVLDRRGRQRLVVAIEFLQQGVSVLIEDFQVERIDG